MKRCRQREAAGELMTEKLTLTTARLGRKYALRELNVSAEFFFVSASRMHDNAR